MAETKQHRVIAADLEGTLTTGATWRGLGRYLVQHGYATRYRLFFLRHLPAALLTRLGFADRQQFALRWLAAAPRLLAGFDEDQLAHAVAWIVEHELWAKRRDDVLSEIASQQQAGARLILVSGAYQPFLEGFATRIGADGAVGTPLEVAQGRLTGRLQEQINLGEQKAAALHALLNGSALAAAYGDSLPDLPMLEMSQHPVAVYPDADLNAIARQRGWRVIDSGE